MAATRIKVCGITNLDDARQAVRLGVDSIGFIFANSPRQVTAEQVHQIINKLPPFINLTGVFVDEDIEEVQKTADYCGLDTLQLHGTETPEYCKQLKAWKVIKAFRVREKLEPKRMAAYEIAGYLLDTYQPKRLGGTGKTFNWDLAVEAEEVGPIILAGGLNPDNITTAVKKVEPYGVDINSGVESSPGQKDQQKLKRVVNNIRRLEYAE
ncbi:phosphoribosylanthranilate isomerase [Acetohalobium arabaticum]|uniref:N-(5'-phosphoribosyl)anthranilate isomerase n=1 Tax=Acetohalobium arabaticum (strain ATCC 49924 / DSM 5501 / Z-7288) TaxID=574087 RepID=D9QS79_ACEAZ|nr:phosphoribosylanthranilate isomerase [Acetohalobium arabaticum]ADL13370.1 phosphoribosylanthranilate isomerase [Acetohalobium arabaticum DSM 5501]